MKSKKCFIVIVILLLMNGCSKSPSLLNAAGTPTPEITPSITQSPTPTNRPTATPVPTVSPTPIVTTPVEQTSGSLNYELTAAQILKNMTLEEKVGQMFFVRCNNQTSKTDIPKYNFGGYILFSDDFMKKTKKEVKETIQGYQDSSKIPMLIGVDEEGGTVNRISKYIIFRNVPFKSPQELYKLGGFDLITSDTVEKAELLKNLGINVNLAPVCDVSTDPTDFIYKRSFGKNAIKTSEYVRTVVTAMNSEGIGCTLKHFPGYGNNIDTHTGSAVDTRSAETFEKSDFLPFKAGISAGAGSILVCHNIVECFDSTNPASLSPAIHDLLRKELGFSGVIMTDDLSMDAITLFAGKEEAAVLAVLAGNDLLISSDYDIQIPAVISAVKNNRITEARINESVKRIIIWKLTLGLIPE